MSLIITGDINQLSEIKLKLNSIRVHLFFEKVVLLGIIEFHGLQDDLKLIWKTINPWPLSCTDVRPREKKIDFYFFYGRNG